MAKKFNHFQTINGVIDELKDQFGLSVYDNVFGSIKQTCDILGDYFTVSDAIGHLDNVIAAAELFRSKLQEHVHPVRKTKKPPARNKETS